MNDIAKNKQTILKKMAEICTIINQNSSLFLDKSFLINTLNLSQEFNSKSKLNTAKFRFWLLFSKKLTNKR